MGVNQDDPLAARRSSRSGANNNGTTNISIDGEGSSLQNTDNNNTNNDNNTAQAKPSSNDHNPATPKMKLHSVLLTIPVSPSSLNALNQTFSNVIYCPPPSATSVGKEDIQEQHRHAIQHSIPGIDVLITSARHLALLHPPPSSETLEHLKLVQLASAGVDTALQTAWMKSLVEGGRVVKSPKEWMERQRREEERKSGAERAPPPIAFTNASGIHVRSISQYCLATLLNLYHALDQQIVWARTRKVWADEEEFVGQGREGYGVRTVYGKTVGMLGYGHIGRETARLFQVFGVDVIAATSSGVARPDDGYILPGTGDKEGTIPSKYYKTTDREAFHAFLARSDILICSVPSTNATRGLLGAVELGMLPHGAVVINVGRGDLIHTDALLEALDQNVSGAALDVTSPEPLPPNHPLFTHPRCIVTPHLSGTVENELDEVVRLCLSSVNRMRRGEAPWGIVDVEKGY